MDWVASVRGSIWGCQHSAEPVAGWLCRMTRANECRRLADCTGPHPVRLYRRLKLTWRRVQGDQECSDPGWRLTIALRWVEARDGP